MDTGYGLVSNTPLTHEEVKNTRVVRESFTDTHRHTRRKERTVR